MSGPAIGRTAGSGVFAAIAFAAASPVAAVDCIDYAEWIHSAARVTTPGRALAVALDGDLLAVACGEAGLLLVDVRDPAHPVPAPPIALPGFARDVALQGGKAFVAARAAGLHVVDVSSRTIRAIDTPGLASAVALDSGFAFVADNEAGLAVVDVRDPEASVLVASVEMPAPATGVAVRGDWAYVTGLGGGLFVFDVSDPAAPVPALTIDTPGAAEGVAWTADRAYIADGDSGVRILDATSPGAPADLWSIETPGYASASFASGDLLWIADGPQGVQLFDMTGATPEHVTDVDTYGTTSDLVAAGGYLFVAAGTAGVEIVDVDPALPAPLGTRMVQTTRATRVAARDGLLYVTRRVWPTLVIFDATDPLAPVERGSVLLSTRGTSTCLALDGPLAWVGNSSRMLHVVDISDPDDPRNLATVATSGGVSDVAVAGHRVFAATYGTGGQLEMLDATDPSAPIPLAPVPMPDRARGVLVREPWVYVAVGAGGLVPVDVTDPAAPVVHPALPLPVWSGEMAARDPYVYVAGAEAGIHVVDVREPSAPVYVGTIDTPGNAQRPLFVRGRLYVADGTAGVIVFDAASPELPRLIGSANTPGTTQDVAETRGALWATDWDALQCAAAQCSPYDMRSGEAPDTPRPGRGASDWILESLGPNPARDRPGPRRRRPRDGPRRRDLRRRGPAGPRAAPRPGDTGAGLVRLGRARRRAGRVLPGRAIGVGDTTRQDRDPPLAGGNGMNATMQRAARFLAAAAAAAPLLVSGPAAGRTWLVLPGGGGDAPTINAAVDSTAPGDTILVGSGTHVERVDLSGSSDIVLRGEFAATTTIDAGGIGNTVNGSLVGAITIEGLRLTGAEGSYGYGGSAVAISSSDVSIRECILEDCGSFSVIDDRLEIVDCEIRHTDGIRFAGTELRVANCTFEENGAVAVQIWWQGLWPMPSTTAVIEGNVFHSNGFSWQDYAAVIGFEPWDAPLDLRVTGNLFEDNACAGVGASYIGVTRPAVRRDLRDIVIAIAGNTFVRQRYYSLGLPYWYDELPSGTRIERNVITGAPRGLTLSGPWETQVVACNLSWNNGMNWAGFPDPTGIDGNISAPPKYCAPDAGTFTVAENSPCLAENNACGLPIGAFGVGCGPISVTPATWARIKAAYR